MARSGKWLFCRFQFMPFKFISLIYTKMVKIILYWLFSTFYHLTRTSEHARKNFSSKNIMLQLKLTIYLSFLAFWHVCAIFRELFCETANQSLYTSHNIADFVQLWFCEKLNEKLAVVKIPIAWQERWNAIWEKWLARWFTKCHLHTSRFSRFTNIFSRSQQFENKYITGLIMIRTQLTLFNKKYT